MMHIDLMQAGWTESQWNRIRGTVAEEANKARVAAQALPTVKVEDESVVAVPRFSISERGARLEVDSNPDLFLTTISVNVFLRSREMADGEMASALAMFRRGANLLARAEDELLFYGYSAAGGRLLFPRPGALPGSTVVNVTNDHDVSGLVDGAAAPLSATAGGRTADVGFVPVISEAIANLELHSQTGPFACILGHELFQVAVNPTVALVMPRDRALPLLQGPLLRSSSLETRRGLVIALGGNPVEIVRGPDIHVGYLHRTLEPRFVFRISERVAVRIKDETAIQQISR